MKYDVETFHIQKSPEKSYEMEDRPILFYFLPVKEVALDLIKSLHNIHCVARSQKQLSGH